MDVFDQGRQVLTGRTRYTLEFLVTFALI